MEKKYQYYNQFKKYLLQNLFNEQYQNMNFERLIDKTEIKK